MTDKILDNLILLSQHVCDAAGIKEIVGTHLSFRIEDLEKYIVAISQVRDMTFED